MTPLSTILRYFDPRKYGNLDITFWVIILYCIIIRFLFAFFNFRRWSFRHWLSLLLNPLSTMAWYFFYTHRCWNPLSGTQPKIGFPSCAPNDIPPCSQKRMNGHLIIAGVVTMLLAVLSDRVDDYEKQRKKPGRKETVGLKKVD